MKTVIDIQVIRRLHELEGWSERRIARELHLGRRTVHKYLNRDEDTVEPTYTRQKPVTAVKMDVYQEVVDKWLTGDSLGRRREEGGQPFRS